MLVRQLHRRTVLIVVGFTFSFVALLRAEPRDSYAQTPDKKSSLTEKKAAAEPDPAAVAELEKISRAFSAVAETAKPSVVNIQAMASSQSMNKALRRLFRDENLQELPITGTGSGVILDESGHIVTNNHVVSDAESVRVRLADGREYTAKVVGTDPKTDLAVIKINADHLPPARWGDSDQMHVGNLVLAIGSPFRLGHSVSHGIISALGRTDVEVDIPYKNWLQTDAPINPGNSGGPLINTHGEVIGINVAIATESGGHEGVGFAIPSNTVTRIAERLKRGEKIVRGYLGIAIEPIDDRHAGAYGLDDARGAFVAGIAPKSPAQAGGLKTEDIILAVDSRKVASREQLQEFIAETKPGSEVKLTIFRAGKTQELRVKVGAQSEDFSPTSSIKDLQHDDDAADDSDNADDTDEPALEKTPPSIKGESFPELGFEAATLPPRMAKGHKLDGGVLITRVEPTGEAYSAQLRRGQVIVRADDQPIRGVQDLRKALSKSAVEKGVRLRVRAGKTTVFTILRVR